MSQSLLATRRFAPLFWCQFFAAFNDNLLKNALVLFILFKVGGEAAGSLATLATVILMAPYFVLSALGGELADKYDKAMVARRLKLAEMGAVAVAAAGFWFDSLIALFVALGLFGALGALFAPIKYGILPDHLRSEELPAGNALIEAATFLAILLGAIGGGFAMAHPSGAALLCGAMAIIALACYGAARAIPATARAAPGLTVHANILNSTLALLRDLWGETTLWRLGIVTSAFWLIGALMLSLLPTLMKDALHGSESVVTIHLALFAVSIGLGSGVAAFLAHGEILLLPAAVGLFLIAAASLDLGLLLTLREAAAGPLLAPQDFFAQSGAVHAALDLSLVAFAGGLVVVPAFAALQALSPPSARARMVAAVNVLNAGFMVGGGALVAALQNAGVSLAALFFIIGAVAAAFALWTRAALVKNPLRDLIAMILRLLYRLEIRGIDNLKAAGANPIIALNHVSFLDAAAILAALPNDPVFAIDRGIAQRWWVHPFLRFTRAIPLDPAHPLGTRTLVNAVREGSPLVIFPEGRLTVTGALMKVYDGAALIAEKSGAMIVPVRIEGPEATMFSRLSRQQIRRRLLPKITLTFLPPVRLDVDSAIKGKAHRQAAASALYDIMSDLVFRTTDCARTLHGAVVEAGAEHGFSRVAVEDPTTGALTYRRLLVAAAALGRPLRDMTSENECVGVLLPTANAAAIAILALSSAGRIPALINFTAGAGNILSGCAAAQVSRIVTARAFVEKAKLDKLVEALGERVAIVYLEDLRSDLSRFARLRAFLFHKQPLAARAPDDIAAILFTSGSEGAPKGVALSHRNILTNTAQAAARIDFSRADKLFSALPTFHSFGLTVGLVLPLVHGVPIFFYPSPLHYRIVPELVYASNATILFGTDTFLAGYARSANAYDFRSIRYVVAGAEPVKETTRAVYAEKFGIRIFEGYGVTETAPVLALNTPMFNKFGTVGRLMPGVQHRLEAVAGVASGGRLIVKGPNVMLGYLKADAPGILQPPPEGWHDTGDIVSIDAMGFITILGRAKRFAKIGGEMVSLAAVEALAAQLWPNAPSAAATEIDPRKGERIVLATQERDATRAAFATFAKTKGANELMIPAEIMIVDELPLLGSGKIDYPGVAKMVRERVRLASPVPRTPNGLRGRIEG